MRPHPPLMLEPNPHNTLLPREVSIPSQTATKLSTIRSYREDSAKQTQERKKSKILLNVCEGSLSTHTGHAAKVGRMAGSA